MNYYVRYINLPVSIHGMISEDEEGFYSIYINCDIGYYAQEKALRHELEHIRQGHLDTDITAKEAEENANAKIRRTA